MTKYRFKVTKGERIMIGRRRAGLTQGAFARKCRTTQSRVSRWETDRLPAPESVQRKFAKLAPLTQLELMVLYRTRCKLTHKDVADMLGCSRYQVIKLEQGESTDNRYLPLLREYYQTWK